MGTDDTCFAPGTLLNCAGSCQDRGNVPCAMDSECDGLFDAGMGRPVVCADPEPMHCPCNTGQTLCTQGCVDQSDCPAERACVSGHCRVRDCNPDAGVTCPGQFTCDSLVCRRINCTQDSDCGNGGYCVVGMCFPGLGSCAPGGS